MFQWNDQPEPEVSFWINEDKELELYDLPGNGSSHDVVLGKLSPEDYDFFEEIDSTPDLDNLTAARRIVDRFGKLWNGKPYTGINGDTTTLEAIGSVIALCRPKSYIPVKLSAADFEASDLDDWVPRDFAWSDLPAPSVYYWLNSNYSIQIHNVPDGEEIRLVTLRPLTEADRTLFSQFAVMKDTIQRTAKMISAICIQWGDQQGVSAEELQKNKAAIDAIDKVMARCFPRSFRPVKRRSGRISRNSVQAERRELQPVGSVDKPSS